MVYQISWIKAKKIILETKPPKDISFKKGLIEGKMKQLLKVLRLLNKNRLFYSHNGQFY